MAVTRRRRRLQNGEVVSSNPTLIANQRAIQYMQEDLPVRLEGLSEYFSARASLQGIKKLKPGKITPGALSILETCYSVLEELFPDRWDIQYVLNAKVKKVTNTYGSNQIKEFDTLDGLTIAGFYLIVHFPEVKVANGRRQSITIKDLFTRIPVDIEGDTCIFNRIEGTRTSMSVPEVLSSYLHSHLPRLSMVDTDNHCAWATFCTGSGDINMTTSMLSGNFSRETLTLLLLQIAPLIEWESLAGVPHVRLSGVMEKDYSLHKLSLSTISSAYYLCISKIKDSGADIDWRFYNGKYYIVDNDKFEKLFDRVYAIKDENRFVYKDEQGNYFSKKQTELTSTEPSGISLLFRGNRIPFLITGKLDIPDENDTQYIHPQIKNYVKSKLEFKINSSKVRSVAVKQ